jgi:DNA-binding GntR family transcriptional regulator
MSVNGSLTQDIYGRIREDLIACKLPPGERLKTKALCHAHDVSLGVVREALSRLTAEGFVLAEPQRGFRAPVLSIDELIQLSEATVTVEAFCLRRAIETGDLEWGTQVTAAYYRFSNIPMQDVDNPSRIGKKFTAAYAEFRRALVSACDNKWMLKVWELLHAQTERYRQVCMALGPKNVDFRDGYAALVEAALARDADLAVMLLEKKLNNHVLRMRDALQHSTLLYGAQTANGALAANRSQAASGSQAKRSQTGVGSLPGLSKGSSKKHVKKRTPAERDF